MSPNPPRPAGFTIPRGTAKMSICTEKLWQVLSFQTPVSPWACAGRRGLLVDSWVVSSTELWNRKLDPQLMIPTVIEIKDFLSERALLLSQTLVMVGLWLSC